MIYSEIHYLESTFDTRGIGKCMEEEVGYRMRRMVIVRAKKVQGSWAIDSHQPHNGGAPAKKEQEKK